MADALGIKIGNETRMFQDQVARAAANQAAQDASTALANANAASQRVATAEQTLGAQIDDTQQVLEQQIDASEQGLQNQIDTINNDFDSKVKDLIAAALPTETVVWTNPNPGNEFANEDVVIPNMTQYNRLKIYFNYSRGQTGVQRIEEFEISGGGSSWFSVMTATDFAESFNGYIYCREFNISPSGNNIHFTDCIVWSLDDLPTKTMSLTNGTWIPAKIVGIKNPA